ncbi:MAG: hypothetical protein NVSMB7_02400 [Chitinophagaceae bacterium]
MDQKTISWLSYVTLIGLIIALIMYNSSNDKSSLARFHLRQSFGIFATGIALYIAMIMMVFVMPFFFFIIPFIGIAIFILAILGLIAAVNGEEKPVPLLGDFYQKTFTFIN